MRLTKHTDFALRVLMYLAVKPGELQTIPDIASTFGVSRNHLMKVVNNLVVFGYLDSVRGRNGGLKLAKPKSAISIGAVVQDMEFTMELAACDECALLPVCKLKPILAEGARSFIATLDKYTLADLTSNENQLLKLVG